MFIQIHIFMNTVKKKKKNGNKDLFHFLNYVYQVFYY